MKQNLLIGIVTGAIAVTAAGAVAGYRMLDNSAYAEVISVKPATKNVSVPRQECHDVLVTRTKPTRDPNQIVGTVAGAIVGGVIGNQVGGGNGKKLATVGGAVGGGYAGNKIQENLQEDNTYQESRQECSTVRESRQAPDGYDVTYRLAGQEKVVRMAYDPGKRIAVENGSLVIDR